MPPPRFALAAASLFLVALPPALRAELRFEATEIVLKPAYGEVRLETAFKFKNTGKEPLTLTRVYSGCGCTIPEKPEESFAPGAAGSLPIVYQPGERQGRQETALVVETSDGKVHDLKLVVEVPQRVAFAPRLLFFRGGEAEPKAATVTYAGDPKTELLDVSLAAPGFEFTEKPELRDGVVKLSIRHVGEAGADTRGTVRLRSRDSAGTERTDVLYLRHAP